MSKTAGGIFKAGAGCAGCGGLGSFTTGIFAGPTALGTALAKGRRSLRGFGDLDPNDPTVIAKMDACAARGGNFDLTAGACSGADPTISACLDAGASWDYTNSVCNTAAPSGGACNSAAVISAVQAKIGTSVDGKWGPNSQAALTKSGQSFQALAPGCTGAVPSSGGGTTTYVPPTKTPGTVVPKYGPPASTGGSAGIMGFLQSSTFGIPMYAWLGVGAAMIGAYVIMQKKQHEGFGMGGYGGAGGFGYGY